MSNTTWTIDFDGAMTTLTLNHVDTLTKGDISVPVWQVADPAANDRVYSGRFVRYMDLPKDLAERFKSFQLIAQLPFRDAAYDHDLRYFFSQPTPAAKPKQKRFR